MIKFLNIIAKQRAFWISTGLIGAFILFFQSEITFGFRLSSSSVLALRISCFSFIFLSLTLVLLNYLKGDKVDRSYNEEQNIRRSMFVNESLKNEIEKIYELLLSEKTEFSHNQETNKIVTLTDSDKEKLFDIITKTISLNVNSEFLKSLDEKYSLKIFGEAKYKELLQTFDQTVRRITKEIDNLSRRANLNLVIGSVTTIMAVAVLFTSVYGKEVSFIDTAKTLSYFIPRISTVIFIEIFSFFFLKLYRSNLNDVKYYQNEMTNIEFKVLSIKSALMTDDKKTLNQIILDINKTERNYILKKGETTVEIEAAKSQNNYDKSFTDNLKSLVDSISKLRVKDQ